MPQNKVGVGATIIAPELDGEGFIEISPNKTLFIQKLTMDDAVKPEVVEGLETVEDVFAKFKPECDVELDKEDGSTIKENFKFLGLGDFDVKNLPNQSPFLKNLDLEYNTYLEMIRKLRENKTLIGVAENPETKNAFINSLKSLISDLEEAD